VSQFQSVSEIEHRRVDSLSAYQRNARTHSKKQIRQIANSIERFGFTNPVLVADDGSIIAGHGRVAAAFLLGMQTVPVARLSHLSEAERRAYVLADNKLALNAGWDPDLLAFELQELIDVGFDVELTGFSLAEVDFALDDAAESDPEARQDGADIIPPFPARTTSRAGDLWQIDRHLLLCGDARAPVHYARLMGQGVADLVFTDPPYNVPIDGHVCGLGRVRHREFAMGAGEMSKSQFVRFLSDTIGATADHCHDGAILFVCMDWRHVGELLAAGDACGLELKNLCVWNKTNGGMGAFYRSKHELVLVFKKGSAPHINSFSLGETGRYRTNVWDYPGISSLSRSRGEELAMHPTVKPVALVADAIRDCSRRGDVVLDAFAGSGTTLIAAHKTGRIARLIEFDPRYCDVIIRRAQAALGKVATDTETGRCFEDIAAEREGLANV
jgi:DNA modification methylase